MTCDHLLKKRFKQIVPGAVYCGLHATNIPNFHNLNDAIPDTSTISWDSKHSDESSSPVPLSRDQPSTYSTGALVSNIKSLINRHRFPMGKTRLPLISLDNKTQCVSFAVSSHSSPLNTLERVQVRMLCYETSSSIVPLLEISLQEAEMLARTCTELGPTLYLMTKTGCYQFQCSDNGSYPYQFWETQMTTLGVKLIMPQDFFVPTSTQPIGEGSFAKVFTAIHRVTGEPIVIKRLPKSRPSNLSQDQQSAIKLEISILRTVSHPYIVKFEVAYEDECFYYIVLEKLRGGTANKWLRQHKLMTEAEAQKAITRVLAVLSELRANRIVHRDLKLENLVLENADDPTSIKIIDFGLAAYLDTPRMKMFCGSPGFVAPEIIEKQAYGSAVDLFSAGVLLYAFLSGRAPFHSEKFSPSGTLLRNRMCKVSFDDPVWENISAPAKAFLFSLLEKDPSKRMTLDEALSDPWIISQVNSPSQSPGTPPILPRCSLRESMCSVLKTSEHIPRSHKTQKKTPVKQSRQKSIEPEIPRVVLAPHQPLLHNFTAGFYGSSACVPAQPLFYHPCTEVINYPFSPNLHAALEQQFFDSSFAAIKTSQLMIPIK